MTAPFDRSRPRLLVLTPPKTAPAAARIRSELSGSYELEIDRTQSPLAPGFSPPSGLARALLAFDRRRIAGTTVSPPADPAPEARPSDQTPPTAGGGMLALAISLAGPDAADTAAGRTTAGCLHVEAAETAAGVRGFRAVLRGSDALETSIFRVHPDGRRELRAVHRSRVHPRSPSRTEAWHLAKLARTVARVISEVLEEEPALPLRPEVRPFGPDPAVRRTASSPLRPARSPGTRDTLALLPRLALRRLAGTVHDRLRHRHWRLGLARGDDVLERIVAGRDPGEVELLVPPADRFWADPFPIAHDDAHTILFEEWIYAERRARIASVTVRPGAPPTEPRTVLETPHHLSYPFVFEWEGAWHLMPEATAGGELVIYRAVSFPDVWEPVGTVSGPEGDFGATLVDATLHREGTTWWLFGVRQPAGAGGRDEDLHLYRADSPLGPWESHPANPVVSDPTGARPAGALFRAGGALVRPAQDCAARYGHRISLRRVTTLDPDRYSEEPLATIEPSWAPGLTRTHTFGSCPGLVVLDGCRDRWGFRPPH